MVPAAFQTQRALKLLNVGAVGLAMAAVVGAVFTNLFNMDHSSLATGMPTWVLGTLWAWMLRAPRTVGKTTFRWGWVASMPLAILNASMAMGLLLRFSPAGWSGEGGSAVSRFFAGAIAGATLGAFFWLPALIVTLVCFGVPIAWAQRLAKKGLAGEERGEWMVGLVCVAMSALGCLLSLRMAAPHTASGLAGEWMTRSFALVGGLTGAAATALALHREGRRRRFVADAEAGNIEGYRVDPTEEGKVLVRIVPQGQGYRVADFEEEVFDLDAQGEAMQAKRLEGAALPR